MATNPDGGIDVIDLFSDAVDIFREHAVQFAVGTTLVFALQTATSYFYIAGLLLMGPIVMGLFRMALAAVRKQEVRVGDALSGFDYFVTAVLLNIAVVAFMCVGLPLCVLPGLFIFILFLPSYFFILDGATGITEAFAMNREMLRQDWRSWLLVGAYVLGLILVGVALLGVGLIVTVPIGIISLARVYDRYKSGVPLSGMPPSEEAP